MILDACDIIIIRIIIIIVQFNCKCEIKLYNCYIYIYLFELRLALSGAPDLILALKYCDKYVIIALSSICLLMSSSGVIYCLTFSQYSASDMASFALVNGFFGTHDLQSGQSPGATESTNAPMAIPVAQSVVKFEMFNDGILS